MHWSRLESQRDADTTPCHAILIRVVVVKAGPSSLLAHVSWEKQSRAWHAVKATKRSCQAFEMRNTHIICTKIALRLEVRWKDEKRKRNHATFETRLLSDRPERVVWRVGNTEIGEQKTKKKAESARVVMEKNSTRSFCEKHAAKLLDYYRSTRAFVEPVV